MSEPMADYGNAGQEYSKAVKKDVGEITSQINQYEAILERLHGVLSELKVDLNSVTRTIEEDNAVPSSGIHETVSSEVGNRLQQLNFRLGLAVEGVNIIRRGLAL